MTTLLHLRFPAEQQSTNNKWGIGCWTRGRLVIDSIRFRLSSFNLAGEEIGNCVFWPLNDSNAADENARSTDCGSVGKRLDINSLRIIQPRRNTSKSGNCGAYCILGFILYSFSRTPVRCVPFRIILFGVNVLEWGWYYHCKNRSTAFLLLSLPVNPTDGLTA